MAEAGLDMADLLPHQPPMRLLERLVSFDDGGIVAALDVTPESPFYDPHAGVPAWVGVEYLAQAAAAWFTLLAAHGRGLPRAGMLVACRRYECDLAAFPAGTTVTVRVAPASAPAGKLVRFRGEILLDEPVAAGDVAVYMGQSDD